MSETKIGAPGAVPWTLDPGGRFIGRIDRTKGGHGERVERVEVIDVDHLAVMHWSFKHERPESILVYLPALVALLRAAGYTVTEPEPDPATQNTLFVCS